MMQIVLHNLGGVFLQVQQLLQPFLRYADFKSRSKPREFWLFFLLSAAIFILAFALAPSNNPPSDGASPNDASPHSMVIYALWWLFSAIPWFAVQARRCNDIGLSRWFAALNGAAYIALSINPAVSMVLFALSLLLMVPPSDWLRKKHAPLSADQPIKEANPMAFHDDPTVPEGITPKGAPPPNDAVKQRSDGRYSVGKYIFSTLAQAQYYAELKAKPQNLPTLSTPERAAGSVPNQPEKRASRRTPQHLNITSDPDVKLDRNGRYVTGGLTYSTFEQAKWIAKQARAKSLSTSANKPANEALKNAGPFSISNSLTDKKLKDEFPTSIVSKATAAAAASRDNPDKQWPEITLKDDGGFLCLGLYFRTREQAEQFAAKRRKSSSTAPFSSDRIPSLQTEPRQQQSVARAPSPSPKPAHSLTDKKMKDQFLTALISESTTTAAASRDNPNTQWPEITSKDGGGYLCLGFYFRTREQAEQFAQKRRESSSSAPFRSDRIPSLQTEPRQQQSVARAPSPIPKPTHSRPPPVKVPPKAPTEQWIGSPTEVTVGDIHFKAQYLYFGAPSKSSGRHRALVDPAQPLATWSDRSGQHLSYWPHYSELHPSARRAYIMWLAEGRRDPRANIGYVFLYFYGLERRLIKDRSAEELDGILGEVEALLTIYGGQHSFVRYAKNLLDAAQIFCGQPPTQLAASIAPRTEWEIPLSVRHYLGEKVAKGEAIGAEEALCWTLAHPQISPRTPVIRCFDAFKALWHYDFNAKYPEGLKVRKPKTTLNYRYRSASSDFDAIGPFHHLPDIAAISAPIAKFEQLLEDCTEALDPLSRFLGRNPDEHGSALATALMPPSIRSREADNIFAKAAAQLGAKIRESRFSYVQLREVVDLLLGPEAEANVDKRKNYQKRLPDLLGAMQIGFEPDKRFGPAPALSETMTLCLFATEDAHEVTLSGRYDVARTMIEIAVLAAHADHLVVEVELESVSKDLATLNQLTPVERVRLEAFMHALVHNPPKLRAATKRIADLSDEDREIILQSVVNAIISDQRVTPSEVRFLESLYKLLGRPQEEAYSRLHSGHVAPDTEQRHTKSGPKIDDDRLAKIRQDTAAVSTMLASIFQEEEDEAEGELVALAKAEEPSAFEGLDAPHGRLLLALLAQPMEADIFAALCKREKLMPSGAIETINDWAFDILDEVAIEDDDLISLPPDILTTLQEMVKSHEPA